MRDQQKSALSEHYRNMTNEELVGLYAKGTLTDVATETIQKIFIERGISAQQIEVIREDAELDNDERLASPGKRWVAQVFDNLIALVFAVIAYGIGNLFDGGAALALITYFTYYLLSDGLPGGQSLGKRALNIAVVNIHDGRPCGYISSVVRNACLLFLGLIDVLFMLGKRKQRLGDIAANTEVINVALSGDLQRK